MSLDHLAAMLSKMPALRSLAVAKDRFFRVDLAALSGAACGALERLQLDTDRRVSSFDGDAALTLPALFDTIAAHFPRLASARFSRDAIKIPMTRLETPAPEPAPEPPRAQPQSKDGDEDDDDEFDEAVEPPTAVDDRPGPAPAADPVTDTAPAEVTAAEASLSLRCAEVARAAPRLARLAVLSFGMRELMQPRVLSHVAAYVAAAGPALADLTFELALFDGVGGPARANCALVPAFAFGLRRAAALRALTLRSVYAGPDGDAAAAARQTVAVWLPPSVRAYAVVFARVLDPPRDPDRPQQLSPPRALDAARLGRRATGAAAHRARRLRSGNGGRRVAPRRCHRGLPTGPMIYDNTKRRPPRGDALRCHIGLPRI
ncbi:hypothetical protein M885DRAFT_121587 [Pelagophyceae sp. CCMP2097]|nr:hypothetical protein M885DRAFT_121587 [Pelagophyceae sp. CCMP2097]